jgi:hypothetical protein
MFGRLKNPGKDKNSKLRDYSDSIESSYQEHGYLPLSTENVLH